MIHSSLGASTPKQPSTNEVEDGEVDDIKSAGAAGTPKPPAASAALTDAKPATTVAPASTEPRKSEVLQRRDEILREKEAARAAAAAMPPRPDVPRGFGSDRSYNLPSRPEAPLPRGGPLDRHPSLRHGDRRDTRDTRLPEPGRLDRPGPGDRPPRDYQGNDRRGLDQAPRDFGRPSDRDRDRARPDPPPRWTGESARDTQDRGGPRGVDQSGRLSRDGALPPPRMAGDRGHPGAPEKLQGANVDRQEFVNPERAAIISSTNTPPRSDSPRRLRDDDRDRSRPQSPRRYNSERDHQDSRHDDRPGRIGPADGYTPRSREDMGAPPAGPRNDRPTDRIGDRGGPDRSRDAFQPSQPPARSFDPNHGRLNNRQQSDPNFGRLNDASGVDIPSGPRDRIVNTRGNRIVSAPQTRREGRMSDIPRPPTPPEVSVPTGPSSTRQSRRPASGHGGEPNTPSTPSGPPNTSNYNDRPAAEQQTLPSDASQPGMHPDRLKAFANDGSSSSPQAGGGHSRPPLPSVVTQGPPSRGKMSQASPVSAGGSGLPAPTGPASAIERPGRGSRQSQIQLNGINDTLSQANKASQPNVPGRMNVRGRGARLAGEPFSGPPTPVGPPSDGRQDAGHDLMNPTRADLITGGGPSDPRDRGRHDRPTRHSQPESRSPTRERSKRGPGDNERDPGYREYRERKEGGHGNDDRPGGRDGSRNVMPGGGRDLNHERDNHREPMGRRGDPRERGQHDAPWTGPDRGERGGGRGRDRDFRGDDRRDNRGPRDDGGVGRKRRSEEGMADRGQDGPKRARR